MKTQSFKARIDDAEALTFGLKVKLDSLKKRIMQETCEYSDLDKELKRLQMTGTRRTDELETTEHTNRLKEQEKHKLATQNEHTA